MSNPPKKTGSIGAVLFVAIIVGAYFFWPRIQSIWDVRQLRIAPDIADTEIREVAKKLEPSERQLFDRYLKRRRPDATRLGDWGSKVTVADAMKEQASLEQLVREVDEAKSRLRIRQTGARLYQDEWGRPALDIEFANGSSDSISKFEGYILFFKPPLTVLHCTRITMSAPITPGGIRSFHYTLGVDVETQFERLHEPNVGIDFVPSSVTNHIDKTTTYSIPAALCNPLR